MNKYDVIVIGAGAAGLAAAIFAADAGGPDIRTAILERTPQAGRKILMSGGTRCNVLPVKVSLDDFVTESSRNRLRNIFKSWSLDRCHHWFQDEIGLEMACEESSGKWFPKSNSAKEVRDLLVKRFEDLGGTIRFGSSVTAIAQRDHASQKNTAAATDTSMPENPGWEITVESGEQFLASCVIIASGGMSVPGTGTDGTGHFIVQKLGHSLNTPYPALTPLTGPHPGTEPLPGVSLEVQLAPEDPDAELFKTRRGGFLFTHQGYSGPAVLDVSHVIVKALKKSDTSATIRVNWTGKSEEWWRQQFDGKQTVLALLKKHLPNRLAENLFDELGLTDKKTAQLSRTERQQILEALISYPLHPAGHLGFKKAEVTGGGVPLDEIYPATMESRILPGLYLCGEILDVFGRIGGFNFYWAWVSGRLAGLSAVKSLASNKTADI